MLMTHDIARLSVELINFFRDYTVLRKKLFVGLLISLIISIALMVFLPYVIISNLWFELYFEELKIILLLIIGVVLYLLFLIIISYTSAEIKSGGIEIELQEILNERGKIKKKVFEQKPTTTQTDVLNTIELNLNQLNEYYVINKNQAKNSFRTSLFAVFIGFLTLIGGIWLFYIQDTPNLQLTALSSISAILIEVIGGSYFVIYKKSLDQLNYFYEKLYQVQNIMLALKINDDIEDNVKKTEILEKIILSLLPPTKEK